MKLFSELTKVASVRMDYDSTDILLERQTSDFYNYICNQNASKFTVQFAVLLYFISTFLSIFIDTSPYYDIIGMSFKKEKKHLKLTF